MKNLLLLLLVFNSFTLFAQKDPLQKIIQKQESEFADWLENPNTEVQIIYTQINRDANNNPSFESFYYGIRPNQYFYPASTVKMPAAFLALEKLNKLAINGLDKNTPLKIGAVHSPQTSVVIDTSSDRHLPTIGHYVKKIFLVSDNDAYNRLYEFLGQRYINEQLAAKGFQATRIIDRLSAPQYNAEADKHTNPFTFYKVDTLLYYQGPVYSEIPFQLSLQNQQRGIAHVNSDGELVQQGFDFRPKNYISLQDLHDQLKAVIFPESVPKAQRFDLTEDDYQFLYKYMSAFPKEVKDPVYDKADNYVKFWIYGDSTQTIPPHIRIFNKVGWAYGFLSDVAYIVDLEKNIEFFLVANIHVNQNNTYNDGQYEYEEIGLPFFAKLGKAVYDYESNRKRKYTPDLSRFKITY